MKIMIRCHLFLLFCEKLMQQFGSITNRFVNKKHYATIIIDKVLITYIFFEVAIQDMHTSATTLTL